MHTDPSAQRRHLARHETLTRWLECICAVGHQEASKHNHAERQATRRANINPQLETPGLERRRCQHVGCILCRHCHHGRGTGG